MFLRFKFVLFLAIALPCVFVSCDKDDEEPYDVVVDFQDATFPDGFKYNNHAGAAWAFQEGIVSFQNTQADDEYGYPIWYGFAYSQMHDVTTPGYDNQFSVYAINDDENNIFMVGYNNSNIDSPPIQITFSQPVKDLSFDVANATYAALSMANGDTYAKKFTETDRFKLTIVATSSKGTETVTINLGEGTKITNVWNRLNFTLDNIVKLEFSLSSTDTIIYDGKTYSNTPSYFCVDNIKARIVK